jgi:hypothetical protein
MTPQEMAVMSVVDPNDAGSYPPVTSANLQGALSQLEGAYEAIQNEPMTGANTPANQQQNEIAIKEEMDAVKKALAGMSPQSPYAYGLSLGMTPAQLQAMGINP